MSQTIAPTAPTDPTIVTPPPAPAPTPSPITSTPGMLDHFFTAVSHGADLIYHRFLTIENDVSAWAKEVEANPALKVLIDEAVVFTEGVLTAHGVPVTTLISTGQAIMAALNKLVQSDVTVASGAPAATP